MNEETTEGTTNAEKTADETASVTVGATIMNNETVMNSETIMNEETTNGMTRMIAEVMLADTICRPKTGRAKPTTVTRTKEC